jgi:hypothetical protein
VVASAVALLLVAWATSLSAQTAKQGKAIVTAKQGSARYSSDNRTWQSVEVGAAIKPGSVIQTGPNSYVDLAIDERGASAMRLAAKTSAVGAGSGGGGGGATGEAANVVRITPNSILAIDKLTSEDTGADTVTDTQLDLRAGRIMGTVKKMSAASRYEVKFPTGVAGIRGTTYTLDASGVVRCLAGSLVLSYLKDGVAVTQVVNEREQFDPATGQVTPISAVDYAAFMDQINNIPGLAYAGPTEYAADNTIIYVSPTIGFGSTTGSTGGGGGNNGNGNNGG